MILDKELGAADPKGAWESQLGWIRWADLVLLVVDLLLPKLAHSFGNWPGFFSP